MITHLKVINFYSLTFYSWFSFSLSGTITGTRVRFHKSFLLLTWHLLKVVCEIRPINKRLTTNSFCKKHMNYFQLMEGLAVAVTQNTYARPINVTISQRRKMIFDGNVLFVLSFSLLQRKREANKVSLMRWLAFRSVVKAVLPRSHTAVSYHVGICTLMQQWFSATMTFIKTRQFSNHCGG